jgi:hypothetical protein
MADEPDDEMRERPRRGVVVRNNRRNGSILMALFCGVVLLLIGGVVLLSLLPSSINELAFGERLTDGIVSLFFGIVFLWWAFSHEHAERPQNAGYFYWKLFYPGRHFGIGIETILMVVGIVAALFVIFPFAHELFHPKSTADSPHVSGSSQQQK